jgi:uncharacterized protein YndB with AHSA1/START domain
MKNSKFVYVTYIATTPEKVFQALTEGPITRQYWGHENVSDWKPGSPWKHRATDGSEAVRLVGVVVECAPPRRLVSTWAFPDDQANEAKHTRVSFDIERIGQMVRLTVTHDDLELGSDMDKGIREGWPRVLSSLKSFLETGRPLDTWAGKNSGCFGSPAEVQAR